MGAIKIRRKTHAGCKDDIFEICKVGVRINRIRSDVITSEVDTFSTNKTFGTADSSGSIIYG